MSADKIIITEDGEEINLTTLEREFGSCQFEGRTCYATRQMEFTSRGFLGCFEEAEEGEEYVSEYSAPGKCRKRSGSLSAGCRRIIAFPISPPP